MPCNFQVSEHMKTLHDAVIWCGAFGIPTIMTMLVWLIKKVKRYARQINILMKAQQAQMRSQLLKDFYIYKNRGYIYESELTDWENQYQAYHELGMNGIMDNRRERLLRLEIKEEIEE